MEKYLDFFGEGLELGDKVVFHLPWPAPCGVFEVGVVKRFHPYRIKQHHEVKVWYNIVENSFCEVHLPAKNLIKIKEESDATRERLTNSGEK